MKERDTDHGGKEKFEDESFTQNTHSPLPFGSCNNNNNNSNDKNKNKETLLSTLNAPTVSSISAAHSR